MPEKTCDAKDEYTFTYTANNSGGVYSIRGIDFENLERNGWKLEFADYKPDQGDPLVRGKLVTRASKNFKSIDDAVKDFVYITGINVSDEGCACCGPPHQFEMYDGDEYIESWSGSELGNYIS